MKSTRRTASDRNRIPAYVVALLLSTALSPSTAFSDVLDAYGRLAGNPYDVCVSACISSVEKRDGRVATTRQRDRCKELCEEEFAWMPYSHAPKVALRSHPRWGRSELATGGKREIEFRAGIPPDPCYTRSVRHFPILLASEQGGPGTGSHGSPSHDPNPKHIAAADRYPEP